MRRASVALLVAAGALLAAAIFFSGGSTDGPLAWIGGGAIVAAGAAGAAALSGRLPVPELDRPGPSVRGAARRVRRLERDLDCVVGGARPLVELLQPRPRLSGLCRARPGRRRCRATSAQDGRLRPRGADRRRLLVGPGREGDPRALRGLRTLCPAPLAGRLLERARAPGRARAAPRPLDRIPARARSAVAGRGGRPRVRPRDRGRAHVLARGAAGCRLRDRRLPRFEPRARRGDRGARHRRSWLLCPRSSGG